MTQTQFHWFSNSPSPPARWDLRYLGWKMCGEDGSGLTASSPGRGSLAGKICCPVLLDWRAASRPPDWREACDYQWTVVLGVDDAGDRASLLARGYGEVLPTNVAVVELAARATRIADYASSLRRHRRAGPVTLDLFHRDGRIAEQWLGLHPREFALLWRLAENPGKRVSRRELLSDVWRLDHDPQTNSVQVHVSRLRAKLAISDAGWLVVTDPAGGYSLADCETNASPAGYRCNGQQTLDRRPVMGDQSFKTANGEGDEFAAQ